MKKQLIFVSLALISMSSTALAIEPLAEGTSRLNAILQGHGQPGETATSRSNPEISFRVLANGLVERTNERYGTVSIMNPKQQVRERLGGR
ncbi:hypothetical protein [Neoaquamicrobium sediminum]|uniref:Uncharacterized protein n=1 Tax=Neoaquamicrobium sediminum TaxID=1849104 RepID=A0ABV3X178_9HYPH|nr:hypothetical protein [Mesorhizobium sediminum]NRC56493.1 hypothetical protein [Mesorhizobium sediminum]